MQYGLGIPGMCTLGLAQPDVCNMCCQSNGPGVGLATSPFLVMLRDLRVETHAHAVSCSCIFSYIV